MITSYLFFTEKQEKEIKKEEQTKKEDKDDDNPTVTIHNAKDQDEYLNEES